jgi:hypothetical protein
MIGDVQAAVAAVLGGVPTLPERQRCGPYLRTVCHDRCGQEAKKPRLRRLASALRWQSRRAR